MRTLLLVFFAACAQHPAQRPRAVAPEPKRAVAPLFPDVVIWKGTASCRREPDVELGPRFERDAKALGAWFADRAEQVTVVSDAASAKKAIKGVKGVAARPLLFIYSGHGDVAEEQGEPKSVLCGSGVTATVSELLALVPKERPWATFVLNSCSSGYVDVSKAKTPTAVLSASTEEISAATARDESTETPTVFVRCLLAALNNPEADLNEDGVLTDHELYWATWLEIRKQLARSTIPEPPMPTLRRNASSHLPLLRVSLGPSRLPRVDAELAAPIAKIQVEHQAHPEQGTLPRDPVDYFLWKTTSEETRPVVERELHRVGIYPLDRLGPFDSEKAEALARWVGFFEVFSLESDGEWIHVRRLRDDRLILSQPLRRLDLTRLGRSAIVARFPGEKMGVVRYTRARPPVAGGVRQRFAACEEGEGQCFHFSETK